MQNYIGLSQSHCIATFIHCTVLVQSLTLSCYFAWLIWWGDVVMKQA